MGPRYRFGRFELDEPQFELRCDGRRVQVQPKVLELLLHLISQRGRCVSHRELLAVLWPGEVVTNASIKRAVNGVRRALGERGESSSTVRTVRGRGYQFTGEVEVRLASGNEARALPEVRNPLDHLERAFRLLGLANEDARKLATLVVSDDACVSEELVKRRGTVRVPVW